ncbi:hypothetical protein PANT_13d00106 [Moesziomyces antarcticus T-34]|uniref:Uncharacterized protein n=1 Tax=Pseudozyma antarctica (strain T-34) TaxID=1151754 RepID=M9LX09_PSEA3|nr:hypothetical protein PANT_13d00106 [Moesziomyces antarcticus T-34]
MVVRQRASRPTQPEQPRRPRRRSRSQCKSIPSRTTARQRQLRPDYSNPLHYPQALDLVFAGRASRPQHAAALLRCCTAALLPPALLRPRSASLILARSGSSLLGVDYRLVISPSSTAA